MHPIKVKAARLIAELAGSNKSNCKAEEGSEKTQVFR